MVPCTEPTYLHVSERNLNYFVLTFKEKLWVAESYSFNFHSGSDSDPKSVTGTILKIKYFVHIFNLNISLFLKMLIGLI